MSDISEIFGRFKSEHESNVKRFIKQCTNRLAEIDIILNGRGGNAKAVIVAFRWINHYEKGKITFGEIHSKLRSLFSDDLSTMSDVIEKIEEVKKYPPGLVFQMNEMQENYNIACSGRLSYAQGKISKETYMSNYAKAYGLAFSSDTLDKFISTGVQMINVTKEKIRVLEEERKYTEHLREKYSRDLLS